MTTVHARANRALLEARHQILDLQAQVCLLRNALERTRHQLTLHTTKTAHADAHAACLALQIHRVHELATQWSTSPDIQQAAAGRIVLAALHADNGPHTLNALV